MENTEGIKCFAESTHFFSFVHLHSVTPLTKKRKYKQIINVKPSSLQYFGEYFHLVDCHLNKGQFLYSQYKEFRNTFNKIY